MRDGNDAMIWDRQRVSVEISRKGGDSVRPPSLLTEVMHKPLATASHLAVYAGLAPISRGSHLSIRDERSCGRGNKVLKGVLFLSAFAALRDLVSRDYYTRKSWAI